MSTGGTLRHAVRRLAAAPWPTSAAILCLALGLGANTAVFSVVDAVVLRPFPFADQNRLVLVGTSTPAPRGEVSYPDVDDWRKGVSSFARLTAIGSLNWDATLTGSTGEPTSVGLRAVDGSFFGILGGSPELGRTLDPKDDQPAAPRVVVLSDGFWRRQFGADRDLIGHTIQLDHAPTTVIGVMPSDFQFPAGVDGWQPLVPALVEASKGGGPDLLHTRQIGFLFAVGRLQPQATTAGASAELSALLARLAPANGDRRHREGLVTPLTDDILGHSRQTMFALLAGVSLVALIACANVSALLLARAAARTREWAVRRALGAPGRVVLEQLLAESALIAAAGAVAGWLVALWTLPLLARALPAETPRLAAASLDSHVLIASFCAGVLAAVACALAAASRLRRPNLASTLRSGGRMGTSSLSAGRVIVMGEVAIAMVVLATAGLLLQSLRALDRLDLGFSPEGLVSLAVPVASDRYPTIETQRAFFDQTLERLRAIPGVSSAAALLRRPLRGAVGLETGFALEGQSAQDAQRNPILNWEITTPGTLITLGVPLRAGRDFTGADRAESQPVALVSENFAQWAWPGQNPLGRRLQIGAASAPGAAPRLSTVVGVAGNVRYRGLDEVRFDVYVPMSQSAWPVADVVVRSSAPIAQLNTSLRAAVRAGNPDQAVTIDDVADVVRRAESPWRATFRLFLAFATLAVILAAVGLAGSLVQHVATRAREIGIRLALGASRIRVLSDVVADGLRLTATGAGVGLVIAIAAGHSIDTLLFGVTARDPIALAAAAALLMVVAAVACVIPARRAAAVDPLVMLRDE